MIDITIRERLRSKQSYVRWAASLALMLLLCVFPIVMRNDYFGLIDVRYDFLRVVAIGGLGVTLLADLIWNSFSVLRSHTFRDVGKVNVTSLLLIGFLAVNGISMLITNYPNSAWIGSNGRHLGCFVMVLIAFCYFYITRYAKVYSVLFYIMGAVLILCAAVAYLQFIGLDPFGFQSRLDEVSKRVFVSFIGNINTFAAFLCLYIPVFMVRYCLVSEGSFYSFLVCICGFIGVFVSNSDSAYIGMFAAFASIMFIALRRSDNAVKKLLHLLLGFLVTARLLPFLMAPGGDHVQPFSFLTRTLCKNPVGYAVIAVLLVLILFLRKRSISEERRKTITKLWLILLCAGIGLVLLAIVWFTWIDGNRNLGRLGEYLRLSNEWGTGRGGIWRMVWETFRDASLPHKLFGVGPDSLGSELMTNHQERMYELCEWYVDNAHNEFLQMFITTGILGFLTYAGFVGFGIGTVLRKKDISADYIALAIGALCYAMQSFVNVSQIITTPIFIFFIAAARIGVRMDKPGKVQSVMESAPEDEQPSA